MIDGIMAMPSEEMASYAFAAPPNFSTPDDVQEGQPFEVVAKIRLDGGQMVFEEINGLKLDGAPMEETEETEGWEDEEGGDQGDSRVPTEALDEGDIL